MGKAKDRVAHEKDQDLEEQPARLERSVGGIRGQLGGILRELDRRRRELFDVRLQLRKHAVGLGVAGTVIAGAIAVPVVLRARRVPLYTKAWRSVMSMF